MQSLQVNCETGEEVLVDLSAEEIAEVETRMAEGLEQLQTQPTIADKLASVGLSIEELREALGSN